MHSFRDARGEIVTAAAGEVVRRFDEAVEAYLGARTDTRPKIDALLTADADCALAHCLDGYNRMLASKHESTLAAQDSLACAKRALAQRGATNRERMHVQALEAWSGGDLRGAVERWTAILADHPRDLVAIKVSQFLLSYLGESERMRDVVAAVLPGWSSDPHVPGYGFVLGCYAFGLEEAGEYTRAEEMGRRAMELNPADIWAAHAVAHVAEMQGRLNDGLTFIAGAAAGWRDCSTFARHLRWHAGLLHLDLEHHDRVLELYDREVRNQSTDEYLDMLNTVSLLWRLEQAEVHVGNRWRELADRSMAHIDDHTLVFVDLHYLMALAAGGDPGAAQHFLASCERFAAARAGSEAAVMAEVGLPLARAVWAHRRGLYGEVVDELTPIRGTFRRIGGSHAQRDLFDQLLIDSAYRARQLDTAVELLEERTRRRPRNIWGWKHYAAALAAAGSPNADQAARTLDLLREA